MRRYIAGLLVVVLLLGVPFSSAAKAPEFKDVAAGDYYKEAVDWAAEEGITAGTGSGYFNPYLVCTRAQVVTFLWRAAGSPAPQSYYRPFEDVSVTAYYYSAVLWAVEQGITAGTSEDEFSPDMNCSRGQIATFLWRYAGKPTPAQMLNFGDVRAGDFFYRAVQWMVGEGITLGTGGNRFSPYMACTRSQIVALLYRYMEKPASARLFINSYDGYGLALDRAYAVDQSMAEVATVFSSEDTIIEIYRQELKGISMKNYQSYSNAFLQNTIDHQKDLQTVRGFNGRNYDVLAWHRQKLARVEGDKNYYITFETQVGNVVYTIFAKSEKKVSIEQFRPMLESLDYFTPTQKAPLWQSSLSDRQFDAKTTAFLAQYFGEDAPLSWGIFNNDAAWGEMETLQGYEDALGKEFSFMLMYTDFSEETIERLQYMPQRAQQDHKVLELTLQTVGLADGSNMMYDILQGQYDVFLRDYAKALAAFDGPVLFRPLNEMNGDWCPYSAYHSAKDTLIYKEVYRYIHGIFDEAGADNVLWVWNPNEGSFPDFKWNDTLMYYPGDEYVDIVGLTAYNTGTYYSQYGEKWKSFKTLYDGLYKEYCARFAQPLMITEFGCAEMGGNKEAWTEAMFYQLKEYDRIKVAIWWDGTDFDVETGGISRDYRIASVLHLFKKYM